MGRLVPIPTDLASRDPGSFRDPSGNVHIVGGRVFRTVLPPGKSDYEFVRGTGLLERLAEQGLVLPATPVSPDSAEAAQLPPASYVVEHPRLEAPSYPYEWSFPALRDAALLQLDIHLQSLKAGVTLSDASAYNIMFDGPKPVFIDYLSFRKYRDGEFWLGHRQFCEQFLNPLLLTAYVGIPFQSWYRGTLEGITSRDLSRILPLRRRLSWRVFTHVFLQSSMQNPKATKDAESISRMKLPIAGLMNILGSLRSWVQNLEPSRSGPPIWEGYASDNSYTAAEAASKRAFVEKFSSTVRPGLLLDIGCNTGEYAKAALNAGALRALGWESDHGALDAAYRKAQAENLKFLPLYSDAANTSPPQGWNGRERQSLVDRVQADAVFGLALVHHMAIARNIPLGQAIGWIMDRAPNGVIEFVPKSDPMVRQLLKLREDIFADYTEQTFLERIQSRADIVESVRLPNSGRLLCWYRRR